MLTRTVSFPERNFKGMTATPYPEALPPGVLQEMFNGVLVGMQANGDGGIIQSRPGIRAQLTVPLPAAAVGKPFPYTTATGVKVALQACANGYIYRWNKYDTTATQLTALGTFIPESVTFALVGKFVSITGATDGILRRTDLTSFENASGLPNAGLKPTATLQGNTIGVATDNIPSLWAWDARPSGTVPNVQNPNFDQTGGGSGNGLQYWTVTGDVTTDNPIASDPTRRYVQLDDPGSYVTTQNPILNPPINNTTGTTSYDTVDRRRNRGIFTAEYYTSAEGVTDEVGVRVYAYSDDASTALIGTQDYVFVPGVVAQKTILRHVFTFDGQGEVAGELPPPIRSFKLDLLPGPNNRTRSGPFLRAVSFTPYYPSTIIQGVSSDNYVGFVVPPDIPYDLNPSAPDAVSIIPWDRQEIVHKIKAGSTGDTFTLENFNTIAFPLRLSIDLANVVVRIGWKTLPSSATIWGGYASLEMDSVTGEAALYCDISTLSAANRQNVRYLVLKFIGDAVLGENAVRPGYYNPVIEIGPPTWPGNLSPDRAYTFRYREANGSDALRLTSPASPLSDQLTTSGYRNSVKVVLPALQNAAATHYELFRQGGTLVGDYPYFYLENRLPVGADAQAANGLDWKWTASTRTYITNVADSVLSLSPVLSDHTAAPTGATTCAAYRNRLVLGVGTKLYISQAGVGYSRGLYFNELPDTDAPDFDKQGTTFDVGADQGASDRIIKGLFPLQSRLAILFDTGDPVILSGTGNKTFETRPFGTGGNAGLLAPNAAVVQNGVLFYVSADGLVQFDLQDIKIISDRIATLLNPNAEFAGDALLPAAYRLASLVYHADRLLLFAPTATSGTAIGICHVFDFRAQGAWYQWEWGDIRGGAVFNGSGDTNDLVLVGAGGQISVVNGNVYGDTSVMGGAVSPVALKLKTREFTLPDRNVNALRLSSTVDSSIAGSVTFTATGDDATKNLWTKIVSVGAQINSIIRLPVTSNVRGRRVFVNFNASSTGIVRVRQIELEAGAGIPL